MKKLFSIAICLAMLLSVLTLASCTKKTYKIAVVTDVGTLNDKGFNQGTWEGAEKYGKDHKISYKYYQPANGSAATDNDRIAAMQAAITNGAEIIVAPGFLQATAMRTVATANPGVKFIFVDGWSLTDKVDEKGADVGEPLKNVTAIVYKEEESGYLAGYAAVMEGFTKLGYTGGGGGANPACNRFGFGFVQGADAAAKEKGVNITVKYSYKYGTSFDASSELQTQISGWYGSGTEVVFSCGGSMFQSVKSAAAEHEGAKIIGVDNDQSVESDRVITSAVKGLSTSVQIVLNQFYSGKWDSELAAKTQKLGAAEDSTGLPTDTWSMKNFTIEQYKALFEKIKKGEIVPNSETPENANNADWLNKAGFTNTTVEFE